jgi:hypothetical protein
VTPAPPQFPGDLPQAQAAVPALPPADENQQRAFKSIRGAFGSK